jgi:hypothetical protein
MADTGLDTTIRTASVGDAGAIRALHQSGDAADVAVRLSEHGAVPGTEYYVVEYRDEVIAAFTLTELGRLRSGSPPRLFLHEIKILPRFRGTELVDGILAWLETQQGVGHERELLAMTPVDQRPSAFGGFISSPSHHIFKWPAAEQQETRDDR